MPFHVTNFQIVQCDVPDCGAFCYFIGPAQLQGTGWLEIYRLGDDGSHAKQYVCPEHGELLHLKDKWTAPVMRFSDNSAIQQFIDKGAESFRPQPTVGNDQPKELGDKS